MIYRKIVLIVGVILASILQRSEGAVRFGVGEGCFLLDGKPFVVKAAELHYPRIPEPYWEHRIKMCKALGMNSICLYVFWNVHESAPDDYDFTGQNDLRRFVQLCQQHDMKVILRPGPYVCAEWEMGGLPWWLLQKKDVKLRENDPYFLERVDKFQRKIAGEVEDLTIDKGGPIIMVQVENEYGSYGTDKEYMSNIRDIVRKNFGNEVLLFQCDWASNFLDNGLDDLLWTVNFGTGADIDSQFERLRKERPSSPLMCSEYWSGWFDKWGASHETRPASEMTAGIDEMLSKGISFSLYMTHGGTNWGHWAGANSPGFSPDVTSYDYDAPVNEAGQPTPKYYQLREILYKYPDNDSIPPVPSPIETMATGKINLTEFAPLDNNLPDPIADTSVRSMEEYGQGFGSILYRTSLPALSQGDTLKVTGVHDYAQVLINGNLVGSIDRREGDAGRIILPEIESGSSLDILVEAMGRINFGRGIKDYKGITEGVTINRRGSTASETPEEWQVYNLEDSYSFYSGMRYKLVSIAERDERGRLPRGVYRGTFTLPRVADTFLDFQLWGKGLVYVNGYPLGRIWEIGPQQTLYMPGCWLKEGENEILIFDIMGPREVSVEGLSEPVLDKLNLPESNSKFMEGSPCMENEIPLISSEFEGKGGLQERRFDSGAEARYICFEAVSPVHGGNYAAIAELYILDHEGNRIPREEWKVVYADSEDTAGGNHTAEKIFDQQESTYWAPAPGENYPYRMIIDMGKIHRISGIQYLARMESGAPGAIKDFRIFTEISNPFLHSHR